MNGYFIRCSFLWPVVVNPFFTTDSVLRKEEKKSQEMTTVGVLWHCAEKKALGTYPGTFLSLTDAIPICAFLALKGFTIPPIQLFHSPELPCTRSLSSGGTDLVQLWLVRLPALQRSDLLFHPIVRQSLNR